MFQYLLINRKSALAWDWSHLGEFVPEVAPKQEIKTVPHEPYQSRSIPIPHDLRDRVIKVLKERVGEGALEESNPCYRNKWFLVTKKDGGL